LDSAEFDKFADEYLADHAKNLRITGEDPDFFARYKIDEIRRLWTKENRPEPKNILDFGSGIGASLPHLRRAFPQADITAFDVSRRSLDIARRRFGDVARFVRGDGAEALGDAAFDLIFTACVFHHIDAALHVGIFRQLRERLASGGVFVVFEHNPNNPVTRYIVATCPFDENAVLIPARLLAARQKAAGFGAVTTRFSGFFPHALAALRPLEPALAAIPFGAQYFTWAVRDG
jgi:SAM-dependent methyltransferase